MKTGTLYIVPTPIGNLGDMTLRAVEILKQVSLIGAEDTRNSRTLLDHYGISTPMASYHKFNEKKRIDGFLDKLLAGDDIAIISDAGTPGISDPSGILIKEAIENDIPVETLPGATAFLPALVSSGLPMDRFYFIGFLPEKHSERRELLHKLESIRDTLIIYEAPHRLQDTLKDIVKQFNDRKICIARELSKRFETFYRGALSYYVEHFDEITLKGEFVLVLEGAQEKEYTDEKLQNLINERFHQNKSVSRTARELSQELKISKNRVYKLALQMKKDT
ncbi:MAG TPA: 16S rRNA (cytidine(1402)-2'-O)-methyltransferase [Candidatus Cloacimonetes bacterium]|nr:16S rRNA (cytidine(1402)-2'-O)-methyltransferase [Candidatus Cloacimonadota bacterium]